MQVTFETEREKSEVQATLTRLITEVNERSHTTIEVRNLRKAKLCVDCALVILTPNIYEEH